MTPAAKNFYNCLLACYLQDSLVWFNCSQYMNYKNREDNKDLLYISTFSISHIPDDLASKLKVLTSKEWGEVIIEFKRIFAYESKFENGVLTFSLK